VESAGCAGGSSEADAPSPSTASIFDRSSCIASTCFNACSIWRSSRALRSVCWSTSRSPGPSAVSMIASSAAFSDAARSTRA
jgi:hypothetical protein